MGTKEDNMVNKEAKYPTFCKDTIIEEGSDKSNLPMYTLEENSDSLHGHKNNILTY